MSNTEKCMQYDKYTRGILHIFMQPVVLENK